MRCILCISAVCFCLSALAQVNFPFPDSAATWVQYAEQMVTEPPLPEFALVGTSNICITGADTLVAGVNYKKVEQCNWNYSGALREDSGRVYFLPADSAQAYLLYDLSLSIGDTVHDVFVDEGLAFSGVSYYPLLVNYVVDQTGVVAGRKFLRLAQPWGGPEQIWIEGFGSPYGLFSQQDPINVSGSQTGIRCMSHRDTSWYYSTWEVTGAPGYSCAPQYVGIKETLKAATAVYPNPTTGFTSIGPGIGPNTSIMLTDQSGRSIAAPIRNVAGIIEFDLSALENGLYLATMVERGLRTTFRILKY